MAETLATFPHSHWIAEFPTRPVNDLSFDCNENPVWK